MSEPRTYADLPIIICCHFDRAPEFFDRPRLGTPLRQALPKR